MIKNNIIPFPSRAFIAAKLIDAPTNSTEVARVDREGKLIVFDNKKIRETVQIDDPLIVSIKVLDRVADTFEQSGMHGIANAIRNYSIVEQ